MSALGSVQLIILWVLSLGALGLCAFALIDACTHRADAYPATGNLTKPIWLGILAVAVMICVVLLPGYGLNVVSVVAAGIYLAKVRPAVRAITGKGSSAGPYGGW